MFNQEPNSPYDRGAADAYYCRQFKPHYYLYSKDLASSQRVEQSEMTATDIEAYSAGYNDTVDAGDFKDFGR